MKTKHLVPLFFLMATLEISGEIWNIQTLIYATKPLLLTFLSLFFYRSTHSTSFRNLMLGGLICSIFGDFFLMFEGDLYFILGLGSFLITQLLYSIAFFIYSKQKGLIQQKPWYALPLILYWLLLFTYLYPDLEHLFIPVLIYSLIIVLMAVLCVNLIGQTNKSAGLFLLVGVLLFLFSDSYIALNKFKTVQLSLPYPRLVIMTTYIIAQYLITKGAILANQFITYRNSLHD